MSDSHPLVQTLEILMRLGELADELLEARTDFDFATILGICRENNVLRPKLGPAMAQLNGFVPKTDDERELLALATPLVKKIRDSDKIFKLWKANLALMKLGGPMVLGQALNNAAHLCAASPIDCVHDLTPGVPAIVIAAGPSLDKNLHLVPGLEDKAVVISMNRCVKVLEKAGIRPHFVIATDPDEILVNSHLSGVSSEQLGNFVIRLSLHPRMREVPRKRTFLFTDGSLHEEGLLTQMGMAQEPMGGATVAHSCMLLAHRMGCDPIIIIGQDLAFSGGHVYSKDDVNADQRLKTNEQGAHLTASADPTVPGGMARPVGLEELPGWHGDTVLSDDAFVRFLTTFELLIERRLTDRKFINATEGGVFIKGMEHIPLAEAIEKHLSEEFSDLRERIANRHEENKGQVKPEEMGGNLRRLQRQLLELQKLARTGHKLVTRGKRSSATIKQIGKTQKKLMPLWEEVQFAVRDLHLVRQAEDDQDLDDWQVLESEFRIIQECVALVIPRVRQAIGDLP